jgi:hypothetical protein
VPLPLRQEIQALLHRKGRLENKHTQHFKHEGAQETQPAPSYNSALKERAMKPQSGWTTRLDAIFSAAWEDD